MTSPQPEKRGKVAAFWAVVVLGVLALYVLSSGPTHWYAFMHGDAQARARVKKVYSPLRLVSERTGTDSAFKAWIDWWIADYTPEQRRPRKRP